MSDPVTRALRDHVLADEPPLRLNLDSVLRAGRRSIRYRRAAYCGGAAALTGALALAVTTYVQPAGGTLALAPTSGSATAAPTVQVPSAYDCFKAIYASPATTEDLARRITCYLTSAVPAALPSATFSDNPARGTQALVAVPDGEGFSATATVSTSDGSGLVVFEVTRIDTPRDPSECLLYKADCELGPEGEVYQSFWYRGDNPETNPTGSYIYLYSGHTKIKAAAFNGPEGPGARPTMPSAPLGTFQLLALAHDPALVVFP
jgi:hypothetical protein